MKRFNSKSFILVLLLYGLTCMNGYAQGGGTDNDGDIGTLDYDAGAPIDDYILPMAVVGVVLTFYYMRKRQKIANTDNSN